MKAKAYQIQALNSQIKKIFKGALVFGADSSIVQDISEQIARQIVPNLKDDFNIIKITPARLKEEPSFLSDEANAVSFLGGRKLIWLKDADNASLEAVTLFEAQLKSDTFLLISAGLLQKNAALRVFAEKSETFLAIACYSDEEKDIKRNIVSFLTDRGYHITPQQTTLICSKLNENRYSLKSELEKLITYMGDKKKIEDEDICNCISQTNTATLENLCIYAAEGNQKKVSQSYSYLMMIGETPVAVLRGLIQYFNTLFIGLSLKESLSIENAVKKILKPHQFKLEETFKKQLSYWQKTEVIKALTLLSETEKLTKSSGIPADIITERTLIQITNAAAKLQN